MSSLGKSGSIAEEFQKLETEARRLQSLIREAAKSPREVDEAAREWQAKAESALIDVNRLKREANKKKFSVHELRNRIEKLLHQAEASTQEAAADTQEVNFLEDIIASVSLKKACDEIMEALEDDDVNIIELYGIAGVGKTTLARQVARKAKNTLLFEKVVMVSAKSPQGSQSNAAVIWGQIARELSGVVLDQVDEEGKAKWLRQRLLQIDKVLIILDDVWGDIKLRDIGIPYGEDHKGCKVILLTCFQNVCSSIKCGKTVKLDVLTDEEAWTLLKQSARFTEDYDRRYIDIVRRLEGLPFGVAVAGKKLKYKREQELRSLLEKFNANQGSLQSLYEDVYEMLKSSYEYLSHQEKSIFLLCYMFPRFLNISKEELTRLVIGQLFNDVSLIDDVRREVRLIISKLQSGSLLQEVDQHSFKTTSDLFGSFAHWLALKEDQRLIAAAGQNDFGDLGSCVAVCVWTSQLRGIINRGWNAPRLETLVIIDDENKLNEEKGYPKSFFAGMKNLKALSLLGGRSLSAAKSSDTEALLSLSLEGFQLLKKLRTLQITAYKLSHIERLVSLRRLEILAFNGCDVDHLPDGLGDTKDLKLLDLSDCLRLPNISANLVKGLSQLQELHITDFGVEGRSSVILGGLNSYTSLAVLSLKVISTSCPQELVLPRLERYKIEINVKDGQSENSNLPPRSLRIKEFPMNPFTDLFQNVEYLCLDKITSDGRNLISSTDLGALNSLKELKLCNCDNMECLAEINEMGGVAQVGVTNSAFSNLTNLELVELPSLTCLWCGGGQGSLENLKVMKMRGCNSLRGSLFPDLISQSIPQLEILDIGSCSALKMIISDPNPGSLLPKLTTLTVAECALLQHIFLGSEGILKLSNLQHLELINLQGLKGICSKQCYIASPLEELIIEECRRVEPFALVLTEEMKPQLKVLRLQQVGLEAVSSDSDTIIASLMEATPALRFFVVGNFEVPSQHQSGYFFGYYFLSLRELALHVVPRIRVLWDECTYTICLQNLTRLELLFCERLSYVFTLLLARNLTTLKYLNITRCDNLEQLVDDQDHGQDLPTECFPNLTEVRISECYILRRLFPVNLAVFPKLQKLHVARCPSLRMIFSGEPKTDKKSQIKMAFPRLEEVSLEYLPELIGFAPIGHTVEFPRLASIKISGCTAMRVEFWQDSSFRVHGRTKKSKTAEPDDSVPFDWKRVDKLGIEGENKQWPPAGNQTEYEERTDKEKLKESTEEKEKEDEDSEAPPAYSDLFP